MSCTATSATHAFFLFLRNHEHHLQSQDCLLTTYLPTCRLSLSLIFCSLLLTGGLKESLLSISMLSMPRTISDTVWGYDATSGRSMREGEGVKHGDKGWEWRTILKEGETEERSLCEQLIIKLNDRIISSSGSDVEKLISTMRISRGGSCCCYAQAVVWRHSSDQINQTLMCLYDTATVDSLYCGTRTPCRKDEPPSQHRTSRNIMISLWLNPHNYCNEIWQHPIIKIWITQEIFTTPTSLHDDIKQCA